MKVFLIVLILATFSAHASFKDFKLMDVRNQKSTNLSALTEDKKYLVVISQGVECAIFRKYIPRIKQIAKRFKSEPVAILLVNSFAGANTESIKKELSDYALDLPTYIDLQQNFAQAYDLKVLSEAILLNVESEKVLFKGAIDNRIRREAFYNRNGEDFLEEAISQALQTKPITARSIPAEGCLIQFKKPAKPSA